MIEGAFIAAVAAGGIARGGLIAIAAGGPGLLLFVTGYDVLCLVKGWPTPGQVIQWWSRDHPFLAGLFALFVGAFVAHIFWHAT